MKKTDAEKLLIDDIQEKGLQSYMSMYGEGRNRNNLYYQFTLKDGTQRHWTNPSEEFKNALSIND